VSTIAMIDTPRPKRCVVLGGRGFIGLHLVDALLARGDDVRCFDLPNKVPMMKRYLCDPHFESYSGDLVSENDLTEALLGCDVCYHLISTTLPKSSNADPIFDIDTNLLGTVRLLTIAVKCGVGKVIFVSSGGRVYGEPTQLPILETHSTDPICFYGITKLAIEKYLRLFQHLYGLDYTVLRIANPFGERQRTQASQGVVAVFMGKVLRGEPVEIWGDGSVVRDYIYIADVINALLVSSDYSGSEHVFNIGSGRGHSLNEVLDAIEKITGLVAIRCNTPSRVFDVPASVLSIERARYALGWSPQVNFDDGLRRFFEWIKGHPTDE